MTTVPNVNSPYTTQSEKSRTTLAGDVESFLKLLTTQLQHQDPLSPMDSTEFTAQLAQFASVEQSIQTNSNLESLLGLTAAAQTAAAVNYLGKTIEAVGDTNYLTNGEVTYKYQLDNASAATTIVIYDTAGKIVYSTPGQTTAGIHEFTWDGKDKNGNQLPDGAYKISVTAMDTEGESKAAPTYIVGTVDGADTSTGSTNLLIGKVIVPFESVLTMRIPGVNENAGTNTGTDTDTATDPDTDTDVNTEAS